MKGYLGRLRVAAKVKPEEFVTVRVDDLKCLLNQYYDVRAAAEDMIAQSHGGVAHVKKISRII